MPKMMIAKMEVPSGSRGPALREWLNTCCRGHGFKFLSVEEAPAEAPVDTDHADGDDGHVR